MLDAALLILAGLTLWLALQNRTLAHQAQELQHELTVRRQLLDAELARNRDLINTNYMLASLNEDLYQALDRAKPLVSLLSCVTYRN